MRDDDAFRGLVGKRFPVLDDGHVILIDAMGDDMAVVDAARISYGREATGSAKDRELLRYMLRNNHGTPFEMCEVKLRVRVPMDCWRQWIRHRTANVNEYSTRYSEAIDAKQKTEPGQWRLQSTTNKQGSGGFVEDWPEEYTSASEPGDEPISKTFATPGDYLANREVALQAFAHEVYEERLKFGVAREQARKDLPLSTYTEAIWKCDLRNLLHFLGLRMDPHAQKEIRDYAGVIFEQIVRPLYPITAEAFEDYVLGAVRLTRLDVLAIERALSNRTCDPFGHIDNKREREECLAKLKRLGVV